MDYTNAYKSFINSQHLSEGVRITSGVLLPAFIMSSFNMLSTGIIVSLGALFVSITDSPGPIHHRRNGMMVCIAAIIIVTLLTGLFIHSKVLLAVFLFANCFFFSMIGIYGARAGSVGTASLIVLMLTLNTRLNLTTSHNIIVHSLLMGSGGLWYMCYSMLLYNFRPYRLARQALGDYIETTADYLRTRCELYNKKADYESTFRQLLQQQAEVQHKQTELTELLFKTRDIVKESTNTGRTLVMIHLGIGDIFESIMMSHHQYEELHKYFDKTGILTDYYLLAKRLADLLNEIGIAVKSGEVLKTPENLPVQLKETKEKLDSLRLTFLTPDNIEGFISLRRIFENLHNLGDRLTTLVKYTAFNNDDVVKKIVGDAELDKMITHQMITPVMFVNNLTLKSDIFRHSLRVSIAILAGFIAASFFNIGHSYWILLTIVVILKPAFSLTKKRNTDRLIGTLAGVLIGISILYVVHNNTVLLVLLILLMAGAYSFMRTNYFVMVLLLTPYLILFFHLLHPQDFSVLLKDRIIDTVIGSAIAFLASTFLFPLWEREKIKPLMIEMVTEVANYFSVTADAFEKKEISGLSLFARKNALVALGNLSEAFNRMLSEPKSQQKGIEALHQFVVLNHTITSYIASLSSYIQTHLISYNTEEFLKAAEDIKKYLTETVDYLSGDIKKVAFVYQKESLRKLNEKADGLLIKRKHELEQGLMETDTRKKLFDLKSVVNQFNLIYNASVEINKISKTLTMN